MRRVKVNAQVTAFITLLEALGSIIILSGWAFIRNSADNVTLILSIFLYFVLLSYVYLKNNGQNRERIIEDGWANILRNTFPFFSKTQETPAENDVANDQPPLVETNPLPLIKVLRRSRKATKVKLFEEKDTKSYSSTNWDDPDIKIFTIHRSSNLRSLNEEHKAASNLHVPDHSEY